MEDYTNGSLYDTRDEMASVDLTIPRYPAILPYRQQGNESLIIRGSPIVDNFPPESRPRNKLTG